MTTTKKELYKVTDKALNDIEAVLDNLRKQDEISLLLGHSLELDNLIEIKFDKIVNRLEKAKFDLDFLNGILTE